MRIEAKQLKSVELIEQTDRLIVVNKPSGIAVHGGAAQTGRTLIRILREASDEPDLIHPIHRLDRATSGIVIFAKNAVVAKEVSASWASVQKTYFALVFGHWSGPERIETDLDGKPACTEVLETTSIPAESPLSLLKLRLVTGRNHQIRRHLSQLEHPIVMDDKYGDFKANKTFRRNLQAHNEAISRKVLFLHAANLRLPERDLPWATKPPQTWFRCLRAICNLDVNLLLNPNVV